MDTDTNIAANGGEQETYVPAGPEGTESFNSPSDAARALGDWREEQAGTPSEEGEAPEADTTEATETAETPAIEAPRSWTTEEKEAFKALPPEHQQRIADRERERDAEIRRRQDEIAEFRKATEADRVAALQVKQQYEQALPHLLQSVYAQQAGEFSDIRTWDDVRKMSDEDWPRYIKWDAWQKQMGGIKAQMQQANAQRQQEYQNWLVGWQNQQDKLFSEKAPEFTDPKKAPELTARVTATFKEVGFTEQEIAHLWRTMPQFRDHRAQLLFLKAAKYDAAMEKAKSAPPNKLPPVQRPGAAPARGEQRSAELQALNRKLDESGDLKAATALLMAQRRAAARRAS